MRYLKRAAQVLVTNVFKHMARLDISPHDDPHESDGLRNGVK
jgi:hypothetical protein